MTRTEEARREALLTVVAMASGASGCRHMTLSGSDPYGLTALLIVRGAEALLTGKERRAGAVAPAEAFDARDFLGRLAPLLAPGVVRDWTWLHGVLSPLKAWRRKSMTEAECYERCYGGRRRVEVITRKPRLVATLTGEQIRRLFEKRLAARDREAA